MLKERKGIKVTFKKRIPVLKRRELCINIVQGIYRFFHKVFPNLNRLYQVFLTIPVTTCSGAGKIDLANEINKNLSKVNHESKTYIRLGSIIN